MVCEWRYTVLQDHRRIVLGALGDSEGDLNKAAVVIGVYVRVNLVPYPCCALLVITRHGAVLLSPRVL